MGKQVDRTIPIVRHGKSDNPKTGRPSRLDDPLFRDKLLEAITDPDGGEKSIAAIAKRVDLPIRSVWRYVRQLQRDPEGLSVHQELRDQVLLQMIETVIQKGMGYLVDDFNMANMAPRDIGWLVAVMFDKRARLLEQPDSLVDNDEMQQLDDVLPMIYDELQRRGSSLPEGSE